MDPATGLVTCMIRDTNAARLSATLELRNGCPPGFRPPAYTVLQTGRFTSSVEDKKVGGPTGFAPVPRHSQCRMQLIHLGPHLLENW